MRKLMLAGALLCIILSPSCKKSGNNNVGGGKVYNSVNDITVPSGFKWESSRNVPFQISITDARFGATKHTISVYDGDPYAGGKLLAKGSANTATPYTANLYLARTITEVYVVKSSPDNSKLVQKVTLNSGVTMSIGATDPVFDARPAAAHRDGATTLDDCNTGCTNTITTSTSGLNVSEGEVICITGSNITVGFGSVTGGTIRVCGNNVTLQSLNMGGYTNLLVLAGGTVNISSLSFITASARIINYGTINGVFTEGGYFTNYGTYNCAGDFNIISSAQSFTNNGVMNITGNFTNSSALVATNNAYLNVTGNFTHGTGTAAFENYCSIIVGGNATFNSLVKNHSYIQVNSRTTITGGGEMTMHNGAFFKTNNFTLDGSPVTGLGSTSLVKVTGSLSVAGSGVFTGMLQVCGPAVPAGQLAAGAINSCSLYIPATGCFAEGNGTSTSADADGDGIPDVNDEYPSDATRAYNSYYPASTGGGTLAFEDQWPTKGDFDMNDVVVGYRYQIVTNASNAVVKVIGNYTLLATGGDLGNGFGVQFPVSAGSVSNVTGGTLEAGQSKAVIIVFNNMRNEMANWNTVYGGLTSPVVNYTVSFDVAGGPDLGTFGLSAYNPFIWNFGLGNNRGREIHLAGHAPTDLGYTSYFGTSDDNSSVADNRYYVTGTGLPYAIDIPVSPFNYPVEQKDITQAYLHFGAWGESGGTSYPDWYSNTASDYRNTSNLYNH